MNFEIRTVRYGEKEFSYQLERRNRKTMSISVLPGGTIEVAAPISEKIERIEAVILRRMPWIQRQRATFERQDIPQATRQFLSGETHWYRGRQYRLKVEMGIKAGVRLTRGRLLITSHTPSNPQRTRELLDAWRRQRARIVFSERLKSLLRLFPEPDSVRPISITIRQLSKRWGSMSPDGRLMLNLDLINAPTTGIDYVIVHELCHRVEHHHGRTFWNLLSRILPDWEQRKTQLEITPRYSR